MFFGEIKSVDSSMALKDVGKTAYFQLVSAGVVWVLNSPPKSIINRMKVAPPRSGKSSIEAQHSESTPERSAALRPIFLLCHRLLMCFKQVYMPKIMSKAKTLDTIQPNDRMFSMNS